MIDPSDLLLMSSTFFQPFLGGATESEVRISEGLPLLSYTLYQWGEILQVLEVEA